MTHAYTPGTARIAAINSEHDSYAWWVAEGAEVAHRFPAEGSGFQRSTCDARVRWSVTSRHVGSIHEPACAECTALARANIAHQEAAVLSRQEEGAA